MGEIHKSFPGEASGGYTDHGIDNTIDISTDESGPFSLGHTVEYEKAVMDSKEVSKGERFSDNGSRIPGALKARNDNFTKSKNLK